VAYQVRRGIEVPVTAEVAREPALLEGLVLAAGEAGFDSVWLNDAPPAADGPDAATLAGSLVTETDLLVGLVVEIGGGRLPAIVAREVATLDVLSRGGVAVLFEARGARPTDHDALDEVTEAVAVSQALFRGEPATFDGRYFTLADAVHRPAPLHPGSPLLAVELGAGVAGGIEGVTAVRGEAGHDPSGAAFVWRGFLGSASATWEAQLDELAGLGATGAIVTGAFGGRWAQVADTADVAAVGAALEARWPDP
jgi:alkanesulfonate monooxygenase SsuD/methylene tetrahydromethanopterin reductase-like flavin-dependent oxidoreductase (luciferase family)